jgi:hypothetical protein
VIHVFLPNAILLCASIAVVAPATVSGNAMVEPEAGGVHVRVETPAGPVHLFRPAGYNRRFAGIVVYVHGYYSHVDEAWHDQKLAEQFAASKRNALFVVPEAPIAPEEQPPWQSLSRLLTSALRRAHLRPPLGPMVVAGHSGAYRSIVPWLGETMWHQLILVDGLYGNEPEFRAWLDKNPANQMTLVVKGTAKHADPFVQSFPDAVVLPRIPEAIGQLSRAERSAKLLCLRSQYGHFELITEGNTLPILIARTSLPVLRRRAKVR